MATWTVTAQLISGTLGVGTSDRIWLNGTGGAFSTNVVVGNYQDGTHVSNSSDVHITACTTGSHVHNTKYVDSTHAILDGGSSTVLSGSFPTTANAPLKFNFSDAASVATSGTTFFAYDGTTTSTAMVGITFQAGEAATTTTWVAANGSGSALSVASQGALTSHDFFVFFSATPTATGPKTGKIQMALTYV